MLRFCWRPASQKFLHPVQLVDLGAWVPTQGKPSLQPTGPHQPSTECDCRRLNAPPHSTATHRSLHMLSAAPLSMCFSRGAGVPSSRSISMCRRPPSKAHRLRIHGLAGPKGWERKHGEHFFIFARDGVPVGPPMALPTWAATHAVVLALSFSVACSLLGREHTIRASKRVDSES